MPTSPTLKAVIFLLLIAVAGCDDDEVAGLAPTPSPTRAVTATHSSSPSPSETPSLTRTQTQTHSATSTPSRSATPTQSTTATSTPTVTCTATSTPTLLQSFDEFGGWRGIQSQATGRFRVERIDDVWWLITPAGNVFFSAGVNATRSQGDYAPALGRSPYGDKVLAKYGDSRAWSDSVVTRFARLGLNTIGAWSENELFAGRVPYTPILGFAGRAPVVDAVQPGLSGLPMRDYFSPDYASGAATEAQSAHACAADDYCIGVFVDNELGWGVGLAQTTSFLDGYLRLPAGGPGKLAVQQFLSARYGGDIEAFNSVWDQHLQSFDDIQNLVALPRETGNDARRADRDAFAGAVAARYYGVAHDALHATAPGVLILGSRLLAYSVSAEVVAASAPFVDVVSANYYEITTAALALAADFAQRANYIFTGNPFTDLDAIYAAAGKPVLISEFAYRAADSGLPNSYPPVFPTLITQDERAGAYDGYMRHLLERPYIVGAHWFEYVDEPATGRFDGENSNWGIVNVDDEEYAELAAAMQRIDADLYRR